LSIIGSTGSTNPQTLICDGGTLTANGTGGAGDAGLVIANSGHLIGTGRQDCTIGTTTTFNGDAVVEDYAGYYEQNNHLSSGTQPNIDIEDVSILPNSSATIGKAALWLSALDGDGFISNVYVGAGPSGSTGILVDDGQYSGETWNNLYFGDVWVGLGSDKYGVETTVAESGGSNFTWVGGAVVDGNSNTTAHFFFNGSGNYGTTLIGPYIEATSGESSATDGILVTNASNIIGENLIFNENGSAMYDCVHVNSGSGASMIEVNGRANTSVCGHDIIDNTQSGDVITLTGSEHNFEYRYINNTYGVGPFVNALSHRVPVAVASLPSTCTAGDWMPVNNWNGTVGTCTGSGSDYTIATCGASNTWYCP
jgi:hypothetical protein